MKIIVNNIATEHMDEGAGPVILMLHGWKDTLHTFDPIAAQLKEKFRIVRLDMPGFGGTELPRETWSVGDYADFVGAFASKLGITPHALVGHSFGGRVILKGIGTQTLAADKLVLIAAAGLAKRRKVRAAALKALATVGKVATLPLPKRMKQGLRDRLYKSIKSDYGNAGPLKAIFQRTIAEDLSSVAAAIKKPTLIIWGSADTETPLEDGVRLSELIKDSQFELFQAAGHFVHREHAEAIAQKIIEFL
ncbi:MAG: alpha/beta hydrolase [Candidatus Kaiserbacteria bacterium]|nr:alpha/beta hydrolase [Candidatus Kaiserbacteria bacterium]